MRIKKPPFFQATWGDVTTNTPYRRPTLESMTKWWLDFKNIKGLQDYEIWLVGSFAEKTFGEYKGNPRDLDIVILGDIVDEENLKYILHHGVKMGFENRLLVDITWQTQLVHYYKWESHCKVKIGKTFTKILGDRVHVHEHRADEEQRLKSGLWAFCYEEPPNNYFKSYNRYENNQYEGIQINVREMFQ